MKKQTAATSAVGSPATQTENLPIQNGSNMSQGELRISILEKTVDDMQRLLARHGIKHSAEHDELEAHPQDEQKTKQAIPARTNNVSIPALISQRGKK